MNVLLKLFIIALITTKTLSEETTKHLNNETIKTPEAKTVNPERFIQDLNDADWHIAHLRDAEFDGRRDCVESFADKARRYKKTLKNDGALVMFVSSDPIPFNESDIFEDSCKVASLQNLQFSSQITAEPVIEEPRMTTPDLVNDTKSEMVGANISSVTTPMKASSKTDYQATTVSMKPKIEESDEKTTNKTEKKSRRSEYMFSSVEYYDEVPDFDASVCPDIVDVVELQIDQLRAYDVECENMVEWHSLHDNVQLNDKNEVPP